MPYIFRSYGNSEKNIKFTLLRTNSDLHPKGTFESMIFPLFFKVGSGDLLVPHR